MATVNPAQIRIVSANIENSPGLATWNGTRGPIQIQNLKSTNPDILTVQGCSEKAFTDLKTGLSFAGVQVQPNIDFTDRGAAVASQFGSTVLWDPNKYQLVRPLACTYYGLNSEGFFCRRSNAVVELLNKQTNKVIAVASVHLVKGENEKLGLIQLEGVIETMSHSQADTKIIAGDFGRTPVELAVMGQLGFKTDGALHPTNIPVSKRHDYVFVQGVGSDALTSHPPTGFNPAGSSHIPVVTELVGAPPQASSSITEPSPSTPKPNKVDIAGQKNTGLESDFGINTVEGQILRKRERVLSKYSTEMRPIIEKAILTAFIHANEIPGFGFTGRIVGAIRYNPNLDEKIDRVKLIKEMEELIDHSLICSNPSLAGGAAFTKYFPNLFTSGLSMAFGWQYGLSAVGIFYGYSKSTKSNIFPFKDAIRCIPAIVASAVSTTYPWYYGVGASIVSNGLIQKLF